MMEGCQHVGFPFEVLDDGFPNQRIARLIDHLFHSDKFDDLREVQVPGAVNGPHPPNAGDVLNQVTTYQGGARLEMFIWASLIFWFYTASLPLCFQNCLLELLFSYLPKTH